MSYMIGEIPLIELPFVFATSTQSLGSGFAEIMDVETSEGRSTARISAPDPCDGYCDLLRTADGDVICGFMVVKNKKDINTISHESVHLAVMSLDWASIKYDVDNHEILAYLVGWIAEQFKDTWK